MYYNVNSRCIAECNLFFATTTTYLLSKGYSIENLVKEASHGKVRPLAWSRESLNSTKDEAPMNVPKFYSILHLRHQIRVYCTTYSGMYMIKFKSLGKRLT